MTRQKQVGSVYPASVVPVRFLRPRRGSVLCIGHWLAIDHDTNNRQPKAQRVQTPFVSV